MVAKRLHEVPLFHSLKKQDLEAVSRLADEIDQPAGRVLIKEGDLGHEFFVIEAGTAEVTRDGDSVAELGRGDFFGEMALIEDDRRTATVTATTDVTLIVISGHDFRGLRHSMPSILETVHKQIERRRAAAG